MGILDKLIMNFTAKKQSKKAINNLISGLPPLTQEQQKEFDEMLERDKNAPPTEFIRETLNTGETISKYDFNNILVIDEKRNNIKRYLIEDKNNNIAKSDVDSLVNLINETIKNNNIDINFEIQSKLNFSHKNYDKGSIDFTSLEYAPYTKTGKNSKYPVVLHVHNNQNFVQGEIYYLQNGKIGKSRLFVWHDFSCYTFYASVKGKDLKVTKIEKTTNNKEYRKETIYSYNKEDK